MKDKHFFRPHSIYSKDLRHFSKVKLLSRTHLQTTATSRSTGLPISDFLSPSFTRELYKSLRVCPNLIMSKPCRDRGPHTLVRSYHFLTSSNTRGPHLRCRAKEPQAHGMQPQYPDLTYYPAPQYQPQPQMVVVERRAQEDNNCCCCWPCCAWCVTSLHSQE